MLGFATLSTNLHKKLSTQLVQTTISIALGYNVISNYNFYRCRRLPSALGAAVCAEQKMDKKTSFVVSRSDCYDFPFFDLHKREPRRGSANLLISRSLSFAYFSLARQRKVSSRRSTTGQQSSKHDRTTI
jgi:hypothetical protein